MNRRLGVLISGRGTNLQSLADAIADGRLDATIAVVISNRPDAPGLARARDASIDTVVIDHTTFATRDGFDREVAHQLTVRRVGLVCLAGFMRVVGRPLLDAFPDAVLNVHPSLLPSFPGADAQRQAVVHGVKISGVTVHFVTAELDAGPIIMQRPVHVRDDDTTETLSARILLEEHTVYPAAVQLVLDAAWRLDGRRFIGRME